MKVFKHFTVADLIILQEVMTEYMRELGCDQCKDDLCEHCQRNYDLRQKLIDARSLVEAGCEVTFSTGGTLQVTPSTPAVPFSSLSSPDTSVMPGLEGYETVIARSQPQYAALRTLISRGESGEVMTRWTFSESARLLVAAGADLLLEQLTFHKGIPPVKLTLVHQLPDHLVKDLVDEYQLKKPLRPCPGCGVDLSKLTKDELKYHLDEGAGRPCAAKPMGTVQ